MAALALRGQVWMSEAQAEVLTFPGNQYSLIGVLSYFLNFYFLMKEDLSTIKSFPNDPESGLDTRQLK